MYQEKTFTIPELVGISKQTIDEHYKLYLGYVKHVNLIEASIKELSDDPEKNAYMIAELGRRFSFEFDGMRNHEYYFASLEGGAHALADGALKSALEKQWGSYDAFLTHFKSVALTRGIGWATLSYDLLHDKLVINWSDEQHLGHLTGLSPVLMLDMWEHSFVADYQPSGKKQYIEDFFTNLNWTVIEKNFQNAK